MTLEKIKMEWNQGLNRIEKAEKLAKTNPKVFEMYIEEFHNICKNMSRLMREYKRVTGEHMGNKAFWEGF